MSLLKNKKNKWSLVLLAFGLIALTYTLYSFVKIRNFDLRSGASGGSSIFSDVSSTHWAYPEIKLFYDKKISSGCSLNPLKYCPDDPVLRSQAAILIIRSMYGGDFVPKVPQSQRFNDVPPQHFAYSWIDKLARLGITVGCTDTPSKNYCPSDKLTRSQAAIMFIKAKKGGSYVPKFTQVFNDVGPNDFGAPWISELYRLGYTQGCGNNNYCPNRPITRAEIAVMLTKVFELE